MQESLFPQPQLHIPSRAKPNPSSRRVSPTLADAAVSQPFPNGDIYSGTLSGGLPHGSGKYVWSDGCIYEGDWVEGKPHGAGKFSWTSGASYEGQFKVGKMEGNGCFIGIDGDVYKGKFVKDRKQGYGVKKYGNGDVYRGFWRSNLQEGEGVYEWSNGNKYFGEWNNGVICGRGVLVLKNGSTVEGFWENGVPKEKNALKKRSSVDNAGAALKRSSVDSVGMFPRICIWELDGEAGDITCEIVDNVEASLIYKEKECFSSEKSSSVRSSPCGSEGCEVKKLPGLTISKGHKNYDLMLNLQVGIRHSVGKHASIMRELRHCDFDPKKKFWSRFPPEGSKCTPPHQSVDFRWKDYCPMVFRHLRELFAIDPADYMLAICGSDALREFSSPGKSGSFFYLTQDDRFMIKTVKKSEVKVLTRMLPSYYRHVCQYKNSLVTKFFGVHCVKPVGGQKTRFIVMGNLFCSEYRIHKRFDLKGSSHGRSTEKSEEIDETTTLKDLDLNYVFRLERSWYQELIRQIYKDCEFLEAERIMDYSLLIGVHFRNDDNGVEIKISPNNMHYGLPDRRNMHNDKIPMRGYHLLPDMDWVMEGRGPFIRLGANMPARAQRVSTFKVDQYAGGGVSTNSTPSRNGGGEVFDVVLYFGIIDILQDYDISKKLEHAYKSLQVDPTSISAVDPKLYSKRFRDFIHRIFIADK